VEAEEASAEGRHDKWTLGEVISDLRSTPSISEISLSATKPGVGQLKKFILEKSVGKSHSIGGINSQASEEAGPRAGPEAQKQRPVVLLTRTAVV
jgi:hypothetical protein